MDKQSVAEAIEYFKEHYNLNLGMPQCVMAERLVQVANSYLSGHLVEVMSRENIEKKIYEFCNTKGYNLMSSELRQGLASALTGKVAKGEDYQEDAAHKEMDWFCEKRKADRYREALENIVKHMEVVSGESLPYSTVYKLAEQSLNPRGVNLEDFDSAKYSCPHPAVAVSRPYFCLKCKREIEK